MSISGGEHVEVRSRDRVDRLPQLVPEFLDRVELGATVVGVDRLRRPADTRRDAWSRRAILLLSILLGRPFRTLHHLRDAGQSEAHGQQGGGSIRYPRIKEAPNDAGKIRLFRGLSRTFS